MPWDYASDSKNMADNLSQIANKVQKIRAEQPNLILVNAGETIQGNFVETFKNEPISPITLGFNALKYDVWVMGNHEFDFGLKVLGTLLKQFNGRALAGNIFWDSGKPYLPSYKIIERQGVKIGIIGMITAKDIAYNYQYTGGEITVYALTGKELKQYMEWSADYFNPQRRGSKYSTNDFFDGVTDTINLRPPQGGLQVSS